MSDLLAIGRSGVLAYKGALAAVGENVTNSDTEGFARRSVTLREQTLANGPFALNRTSNAFGGVQASEVTRVWDQYKATNAWSANSDSSGASTRSKYLSTIEGMLNDGDTGVGTRLTAIFTAATRLASDPADSTLRQTMLAAVSDAATALGQTGANLAKVSSTIGTQAITIVDQSNDRLAALGKINTALHSAPAGTAARAQLEDQRDMLVGQLSSDLGLDITIDADGATSLALDNYSGPRLLSSTSTKPAYLTLARAADGRLSITVIDDGTSNAATPTGGNLAGLVSAAASLAGRRQQLDGLVGNFATALNSWNGAGRTAAGVAGGVLLTGTTAATIKLATIDPSAIAAATAGGAANGNLIALSALRGPTGVEAGWQSMVSDQALMVSSAKIEESAATTRKNSAYTALDQVSGIDLDTEAADLLRYQQAYSASAKIIQAARDTLQSILQLF